MSEETKVLLKSACGKRFPMNISKHEKDKTIFCPFCHEEMSNPYYKPLVWKPNLDWVKKKMKDYEDKREAKRFLDIYAPSFSYNRWRRGDRPRVTMDQIKQVHKNWNQERINEEVKWFEKLGVQY